jgi:integrase
MPDKVKTAYPGVRYREHKERKVYGKPDKYFFIRYRVNGKGKEEGLGWSSEGWTAEKASLERAKLRTANRTGEGPKSLHERKTIEKQKAEASRILLEKEVKDRMIFSQIYKEEYLPSSKLSKTEATVKREESLFKCWLLPIIGDKPLKDITQITLERIKRNMKDKGLSDRSIAYALALVRQVYNFARRNKLFHGESPTAEIVFPKYDNRRMAFLSHDQADKMLDCLKEKHFQLYEFSLISLFLGLRSKEILSLHWGDIDFDNDILHVKDTKNTVNRSLPLNNPVRDMLKDKNKGKPSELVFVDKQGQRLKNPNISMKFTLIIKELGFNDGIVDRRQKIVCHSLRHTFCSWLAIDGVDLYTIQKLSGHKTLSMVQRYSHLNEEKLRTTVDSLNKYFNSENDSFIKKPNRYDLTAST